MERYVTDLHGKPVCAVAALGIASPTAEQTDPGASPPSPGVVVTRWTARAMDRPLTILGLA
jgi:hypothetical protein